MRCDRGGLAPTVKGMEARAKIRRLMHGAALTLTPEHVPEDWRHDLRRQRQYVYGGLLRFIDARIRQGAKREDLQKIPQWISAYIDDQTGPTNTGEITLHVAHEAAA